MVTMNMSEINKELRTIMVTMNIPYITFKFKYSIFSLDKYSLK